MPAGMLVSTYWGEPFSLVNDNHSHSALVRSRTALARTMPALYCFYSNYQSINRDRVGEKELLYIYIYTLFLTLA